MVKIGVHLRTKLSQNLNRGNAFSDQSV